MRTSSHAQLRSPGIPTLAMRIGPGRSERKTSSIAQRHSLAKYSYAAAQVAADLMQGCSHGIQLSLISQNDILPFDVSDVLPAPGWVSTFYFGPH